MKLKINDEYVDVGFWSLLKCLLLIDLAAYLAVVVALVVLDIARYGL